MASYTRESLLTALKDKSVDVEEVRHEATPTMESVMATLPKEFIAKGHMVKNLFLYDKKKRYYLVSISNDSTVNLKTLAVALDAPGLRMSTEEVLLSKLKVPAGSVTPFAALNDTDEAVTVAFDEALKKYEMLLVHPLTNEATILVSRTNVVDVVEKSGHVIKWIQFDATAPASQQNESIVDKSRKPQQQPVSAAVDSGHLVSDDAPVDMNKQGITTKKAVNFADWYTQVICKAEMIQYYKISGCYIIRPWAFYIWETVQNFIDTEIKKHGVRNAYFPMFVTREQLEAEREHVEGFSPEVAWVTKYGDTQLAEEIAIRPTSETIMYPAYSKWIRSHRDLPLLLNQWNTVVRWEFKQPTPFIRTREFLWQEGHTAHASDEEATDFMYKMLDVYRRTYEEVLAVPVIPGIKSEGEKFAGAKMTSTVEAYIAANGRGVQAATSHHLGTNFAKIFNIKFEDKDKSKQLAHQTSWGFTTRSIGVMTMVHGDDRGLVLPPRVAPTQVVIIPIVYKEESEAELVEKCDALAKMLKDAGIRTQVDDRDTYTPGWKYNHWEVKGVPLRLEIGPRDMKNNTVRIVRRDDSSKTDVNCDDLCATVRTLLDNMQKEMLSSARARMEESIAKVTEWEGVVPALNKKMMVMAPWCCDKDTERMIKEKTIASASQDGAADSALTGAMKALCIPLEQPPLEPGTKCFISGRPAVKWCLFGRSY
eukprot:Lankesteria_metandrocarpae@DN5234_c0_g1_i1.p2